MGEDKRTMTIEEYLNIRYEVQLYLQSKEHKEQPSSYDKLKDFQKEIVERCADQLYQESIINEPIISKDLLTLVEDNISEFVSFENRIKTVKSLRRKIIADSRDYLGSFENAAYNICDNIRYTIVIIDDLYTEKVDEYLHQLENMGYEIMEVKNNWGKPLYQGMNVRMRNIMLNEVFELQFHTPFGYGIKENSTRDLYEVVRDPNAPAELAFNSNLLRKLFQKHVKAPVGAKEYIFESEIKKR